MTYSPWTYRPGPRVWVHGVRSRRGHALYASCCASYITTSIHSTEPQTTGEHRALVPLLDPRQHSVPFAVALELHGPCGCSSQLQQQELPSCSQAGGGSELCELRYLLAGCGQLVYADGRMEVLKAGDSVLMPHGAALCTAEAGAPSLVESGSESGEWHASAAASLVGSMDLPAGANYSLASLVVYFHKSLLEAALAPTLSGEQRQHAQQQQHAGQQQEGQQLTVVAEQAAQPGPRAHPLLLELLGREWGGPTPPTEPSAAGLGREQGQRQAEWQLVLKRTLEELPVFQMPHQSNRLALAFDPVATPQAQLVFGLEVFEGGHRTPPHVHNLAHELFFIISGEGTAFCAEERMHVGPGDLIVFDRGAVHGIDLDVLPQQRMHCLELMLPNDSFAEVVRSGRQTGGLEEGDFGVIALPGSCGQR